MRKECAERKHGFRKLKGNQVFGSMTHGKNSVLKEISRIAIGNGFVGRSRREEDSKRAPRNLNGL